ncbi:MAG: hypothetical protein Q4F76_01405 [Lachnospiraceae bacterium]|nr:hypothetical protein [Lachnospiraceae bacterium]
MRQYKNFPNFQNRTLLSISCLLAGSLYLAYILIGGILRSSPSASPADCYPAGIYLVGTEIPAGEYVLFCDSFLAYFELTEEDKTVSDSVSPWSIVTLKDNQTFYMEHCHAVPIGSAGKLDLSGGGMFKVGLHLPAGEYTLETDEDSPLGYGYAEISENSTHQPDAVSRQILVKGTASITLSDGEYLKLCCCRLKASP